MLVPGIKASGSVSHLSSVTAFHTTLARLMASEYRWKSTLLPAFLCQTLARLGPVSCSPSLVEWQAAHCWKSAAPRAASPAAQAGELEMKTPKIEMIAKKYLM